MDYRRKNSRNDEPLHDFPTYSRLFVVSDKRITEDQFMAAFSKFGTIVDLKIPRDHNTGDSKGIAFIQFSKTSEAAHALEAMNCKVLPNSSRPLKVMVATNRSEIQSDVDDDEKYKRLFITVPRSMTEEEINEAFAQFGNIEYVRMQRDRNSGESRGFAYVKFRSFSMAAKAMEESNKMYRAIFALPKSHNKRQETSYESNISHLAASSNIKNSLISAMKTQPEGYTGVDFMCSLYLNQMQVESVFDIVPGMISCKYMVDYVHKFGRGTVTYSNPVSAAYAVDKLNQFEYPPGVKIFVKPNKSMFHPHEQQNFTNMPNVVNKLKTAISSTATTSSPDLAQLADAIAEASTLIKRATTGGTDDKMPNSNDLNYCSENLPPQQPLADIDSAVAKRCFLVCKPQPPPLPVLRDVFCRFGDLINVYTLPGKTIGYARYASVQAADNAIRTLHGAEICGVRIKVLEADDEAPPKKARYDH